MKRVFLMNRGEVIAQYDIATSVEEGCAAEARRAALADGIEPDRVAAARVVITDVPPVSVSEKFEGDSTADQSDDQTT
jgi:hypothetical protein